MPQQNNQENDNSENSEKDKLTKIVEKKATKEYLKYSGMGFQLIAALLIGAWGGNYLDEKMGNETPIATLTCLLVMLFATLYLIIRQISKDN